MSSHPFAPNPTAVHTTTVQALLARSPERLPLEIALQLAHEVASGISQAHEARAVLGQLDASTLEIDEAGRVHVLSGRGAVLAPELSQGGTASVSSDVFAAGSVLFEIFTGLTPAQARARLSVSAAQPMPPPSRFNPTLDDRLDTLISAMLARDPSARPGSMLLVQARVLAAFDEVGLEPSCAALAAFVTPGKRDRVPTLPFVPVVTPDRAPTLPHFPAIAVPVAPVVPVAAAPAVKVAPAAVKAAPAHKVTPRRAPPRSWQTEDEEVDEEPEAEERQVVWHQAPRFDGWAMGAICFTVLAAMLALVH